MIFKGLMLSSKNQYHIIDLLTNEHNIGVTERENDTYTSRKREED